MARVVIGIPCYSDVSAETLVDYMRFAYHVGRRMPEHEFMLDVKTKSEQFRARNAIVEASLQVDADYLLFLDDDHVIDWENTTGPNNRYDFLKTLMGHMEADPEIGLIGCLYYHRGGECLPVLMKEGKDGGHYYMRDDQIVNGLQEVAVQGGGCMLIDMTVFDKIKAPWFEPETSLGTDLQICGKIRDMGRKVCCDTSLVLGHVLSKRQVITPKNRHSIIAEEHATPSKDGLQQNYIVSTANGLYRMDVEEYMDMNWPEIVLLSNDYFTKCMPTFGDYEDKREYYKSLGKEQLARQAWFHSTPEMIRELETILSLINTNVEGYGLDFGCGSAPVGFEFALKGHRMDFVDVGGEAYEFLKWRAKKRGVVCGWELKGPYDYVLLLDSLEHIENWRWVLGDIVSRMKPDASIITNYFLNTDHDNIEHVSMDQKAVQEFLISLNVYPVNKMVWMKRDMGFMD